METHRLHIIRRILAPLTVSARSLANAIALCELATRDAIVKPNQALYAIDNEWSSSFERALFMAFSTSRSLLVIKTN
jgi:hypothetical protein